jgi:hypothetical protein
MYFAKISSMAFVIFSEELEDEDATFISQKSFATEARAFKGVTILTCSRLQAIACIPVLKAEVSLLYM